MSDADWFNEMRDQLLDAIAFGASGEHISSLMRRAECPEHAATLLRLLNDGLTSDAISGAAAKEARRIPQAIRNAVAERDSHCCRYCGDETGPFHIDHVRPVIRGGTNALGNLAYACARCNLSKGGKTLEEWRAAK